jgi:hypothetical protein
MTQVFSYRGSSSHTTYERSVDPAVVFRRSSMLFIQEVKRHLGPEKSREVIDKLSESLGKDWSHEVIYDFLARNIDTLDGVGPAVQFTFINENSGQPIAYINVIKEIRAVTGMGLKEAKDAADKLREACRTHYASFGDVNYPPVPVIELVLQNDEDVYHCKNRLRATEGIIVV